MKPIKFVFLFWIVFFSCKKEELEVSLDYDTLNKITLPVGFPDFAPVVGNEFTPEKWALGKKLFYDKRLSLDSTISCGSCHKPEYAFGDNIATTIGVQNRSGTRNVPSLANIAYHPYYTREGGLATLEMQVLVPIAEHNEFDFNLLLIEERLKNDVEYQKMAQKAFGSDLNGFAITRSITNFERSILSGGSKYDLFINGKKDALTSAEKNGMNIFFGEKGNCSKCHNGFNFTDYGFKNNGLYDDYKDVGRHRLTLKEEDRGVFKTPSLRNIGLTAPYMHDGSLQTLDDVIAHYNNGGKNNKNKSQLMKPLNLNEIEKNELKQFLMTLSDYELINNKYLQPK